jgi:hypothetical protein
MHLDQLANPDFELSTFITSASYDDDRCGVEGAYSWCSQKTKQLLIPTLIKSFLKPSVNALHERCLAFNSSPSTDNLSTLTHISCTNDRLPFICEPSCEGPTCPDASSCAKNVKCTHFWFIMFVFNKNLINRPLCLEQMAL